MLRAQWASVRAWKTMLRVVQMLEAWLVTFQREEKTLSAFSVKNLCFWLAGNEESNVINKISELLKQNLALLGFLMLVAWR